MNARARPAPTRARRVDDPIIGRSNHTHSITAPGQTRRRKPARGGRRPPDSGSSASELGSGHGVASLCLATTAGMVSLCLAAGAVLAWIGLSPSDRRTGLAVAGLVVAVMLFGLMVVPSVSDYPEVRKVAGPLAGALLVAGGLLLRRR